MVNADNGGPVLAILLAGRTLRKRPWFYHTSVASVVTHYKQGVPHGGKKGCGEH